MNYDTLGFHSFCKSLVRITLPNTNVAFIKLATEPPKEKNPRLLYTKDPPLKTNISPTGTLAGFPY